MNFVLVALLTCAAAQASAPAPAALPAVGTSLDLDSSAQRRLRLCDFATQAAQLQALAVDADPVFRPPTPEAKAALGLIRKHLISGAFLADAPLAALLAGPEGPSLARLAIQDRDPKVRIAAIAASAALAARHPRLFAFLPTLDKETPAAMALAIADFDFATGCDTPILFSLDALEHPDEVVVSALIDRTAQLAGRYRDTAPVDRVIAWLLRRQGKPAMRARAVRLLGDRGLVKLAGAWQRLAGDPAPEVVAEAWPAWAKVAPGQALTALTAGGLADPRPLAQWGALRAAADACAMDPPRCLRLLPPLKASRAQFADPVTGLVVRIRDIAAEVEAYWAVGASWESDRRTP